MKFNDETDLWYDELCDWVMDNHQSPIAATLDSLVKTTPTKPHLLKLQAFLNTKIAENDKVFHPIRIRVLATIGDILQGKYKDEFRHQYNSSPYQCSATSELFSFLKQALLYRDDLIE